MTTWTLILIILTGDGKAQLITKVEHIVSEYACDAAGQRAKDWKSNVTYACVQTWEPKP